MHMERYPQDFAVNTAPKQQTITCQTADGIQHVRSDFFQHIQHLGLEVHNGTQVFMPGVHVSSDFIVSPPHPLAPKYL